MIRIRRNLWTSKPALGLLAALLLSLVVATGVLVVYWVRMSRMIDQRLSGQVFDRASTVYSAPGRVEKGEILTPAELLGYLQRAGYTPYVSETATGWYRQSGEAVEIHPGPHSYFSGRGGVRVEFSGGRVSRLVSLDTGSEMAAAELEPVALATLFGPSREKRRLVQYADLPPVLVQAVLAAEDKRFFEHPGLDPLRVLGAAWADLLRGRKAQGASTITMQVARSFFLSRERTWRRKLAETLMALILEQRFSKEQIFELYANQVYLGNRGSFAIRGFGEAAQAYFGKDVRDLTLPEAAFLAGMIRAPNRYADSDRHPERAAEARDRVLEAMVDDGMITAAQAAAARSTPLHLRPALLISSAAPYFVDMVREELLEHFPETDLISQSYSIYTTLDPQLQRAAAEAVASGMAAIDQKLARRYARWQQQNQPVVRPQVALVALDPHTGEIRALVGGRDYGQSQLNHALARRQPGSAFKPFVYAAALLNAAEGRQPVVTPVTTVVDEPTTFEFDGKTYSPNNYGQQFYGTVTVRQALTLSLNVATVKIAEMIGYDRVLEVARQMKLDEHLQATPALALGAYEMTPLEVAAGYTAFANGGVRAEPLALRRVVAPDGQPALARQPVTTPVLDPRVAYMVTNLMEDVLNRGTGASVRALGFTAPAAGKTGTSHDGWFAGFTTQLLCVVWVGFDDNRELGLSGSESAALIWGEFMKRAVTLPGYDAPQPFQPPAGVLQVSIDPETAALATPQCPEQRTEVFLAGTEPTQFCPLHGSGWMARVPPFSWLSRWFGGSPSPPSRPPAAPSPPPQVQPAGSAGQAVSKPVPEASRRPPADAAATSQTRPRKGFWQKIFGVFKGGGAQNGTTQPKRQKP